MNIILNGESHVAEADSTISDLLESLDLTGRRVALLMDDEVVRKADHANVRLLEGCRIEIVRMVGGG